MLSSSPRKKSSSTNYVKQGILIGIFILVIVWLGSLIMGLFSKAEIAWVTAQHTRQEARVLKRRANVLEKNMKVLDTSRGYSASIRTTFGVARPDESVIFVVRPAVATSTNIKKSWWRSMFDILHL